MAISRVGLFFRDVCEFVSFSQKVNKIPTNHLFANNIFLSPHSDDVCFSLGVFAQSSLNSVIVSIFTTSNYLANKPDVSAKDNTSKVTSVRKSEDEAFANHISANHISLNLLDAPLRGLKIFSKPTENEIEYVQESLRRTLEELLSNYDRGVTIFAPAGIGGHVDHITTRDFILKNMGELNDRCEIAFYEDLHYASRLDERLVGIEDLKRKMPKSFELIRYRFPIEDKIDLKLDLMNIYKSQIPSYGIHIENFVPAEEQESEPWAHEAFWITKRTK